MLRKTLDNLPLSLPLPYFLVIGISILLFAPTWIRLIRHWLTFEQVLAHGLITGFLFVGLIVAHPPSPPRDETTKESKRSIWSSRVALFTVVLAWSLSELVRIDTLSFILLPVGLVTLSWVLLGAQAARRFIPYLFLFSLSLPLWADIVPYLVKLASIVVGQTVHLFGITVLVEGNSISLPYGRLLIADGCSGIRYFAISILLGTMVSILNDARLKDWTINIASAALLGLIANWVRIVILVVIAYESRMQSELLVDHETMGWVIFGAFALPALYLSPVRKRSKPDSKGVFRINLSKSAIATTVVAMMVGPIALLFAQNSTKQQPAWAINLQDFQRTEMVTALPIRITLPERLDQQIWNSGQTWISLAQSQKESSDDKIVPFIPSVYDKSIWQTEKSLEPGLKIYRNIRSQERVLMGQWYQVGSRNSDQYRKAKLLQIPAALSGETRFALLIIQIRCRDLNCGDSLQQMAYTRKSIQRQL